MKYAITFGCLMFVTGLSAQSITGSWQLTDEKTCLQSEVKEESATEKELKKDMSSARNSVARVMKFEKNGLGQEGIFSSGSKKGSAMRPFNYKLTGTQLLLLDKKSGIIMQQLVVDELSATTLKFHLESKDCESKTLTRIK